MGLLLFPATVGAQDVVTLSEEASSHQRNGALHAGETLAVPLTLLKGDVLGPSQTCEHQTSSQLSCGSGVKIISLKKPRGLTGDWLGAADAFLGVQVAEAFEAIGVVFPACEALP